MSIIGHNIKQDGSINFFVASPYHNFRETMTTKQLLAAQPSKPHSHLQVYQSLFESSAPLTTRRQGTPIPVKLETMFTDCIDVRHMQAAQEIIETCLSSGYYPSDTILLVLMDTLLKRTKNKNKRQRKEKVEHHYKTHALLEQILNTFGPSVLTPLWEKLGTSHIGRKRRHRQHKHHVNSNNVNTDTTNQEHYDEDDDDEDDDEYEAGMRLSRFDDFWDLVSHCFTQATNKLPLNALGCRLALDVLIKLISEDIRSRRDDKNTLLDCLILSSIPANAFGQRSNFERYLDVLFSGIKPTSSISLVSKTLQAENMEYAMTLLNQLILLSYCGQNLLDAMDLADQTYRRILELETSILQHVLSCIQYPAFIASIGDIYFEDADDSLVAPKHLSYRSRRVFSVAKMKNYILKTRPRRTNMTTSTVLVHCLMVMWRWNAYLRIFSYRYDASMESATPSLVTTNVEITRKRMDEKGITKDDLIHWKHHLLDMARGCQDDVDEKLTVEINGIVEMMMLSIDD